MKLLFKQRLFSWFDSYDIYDEAGNTVYVVKGQLSWGHKLVIYDAYGNEVGMVVQKVLTFLPKFEIYKNGSYIGCLSKEFSFLTPHYNIDYNGWHIDGTIMEWDYSILDRSGYSIARVNKELFHMHYWNDANVIKRFITEYPQYKSRIKNTECTKGEEL